MFLNSSTLPSLRFFEAAARLSSFKHAALELPITQWAVSQQQAPSIAASYAVIVEDPDAKPTIVHCGS